jgi:hypothetical protein
MKKRVKILIGILILALIIGGVFAGYYFLETEEDLFQVDHIFLKVSAIEGSIANSEIKITNLDIKENYFSLELKSKGEIGILNKNEFYLGEGLEEKIHIEFNVDKSAGIYLGELIVKSEGIIKTIPIVLEIESPEVLFDSNLELYPRGGMINQGERLTSNIRIYDLASIGRSEVNVDYFVNDFSGNIIFSSSETLIIEDKLDFSKSFILPEHIDYGDYVLGVVVKYGESKGSSSLYFRIENNFIEAYSNQGVNYIILILVFMFIFVTLFFAYFVNSRNQLLDELQKQYKRDLKKEREIAKLKLSKGGFSGKEKTFYEEEIKKVEKQRETALKGYYKSKEKEIKKIKIKKGDKAQFQNHVAKWKKKGYDTKILERKYKYPEISSIKRKIAKWKKKGYDTSILEKKNNVSDKEIKKKISQLKKKGYDTSILEKKGKVKKN